MLKPIFVLASALALTTSLAVAKADGQKTITILTMLEEGKPSVSIELSDINFAGGTIEGDNILIDDGETSLDAESVSVSVSPTGKKNVTVKGAPQVTAKIKAAKRSLTTTTIIRNNFEFTGKDTAGKPLFYKFKKGVAILTTTRIEAPQVAPKPKA